MSSETISTRSARLSRWVTREATGGALLLVAAAIGMAWANSPWRAGYVALSERVVGPGALHLDLPLAAWAADGLLAVFFFVVGVELKHEIVVGSLRNVREAAVPVCAAIGGMAAPAVVFTVLVIALGDPAALRGWAIPTATDIAFALAVLAVFGRGLPRALRTFLLTLAVVDDLLAIIVIAVVYTAEVQLLALVTALAAIAVFAVVVRSRRPYWWLLVPIGVIAWGFMHACGVHATIAGVLMGFCVPARPVHRESIPRADRVDDVLRPISAGLVLPLFAFFAAGVTLIDGEGVAALIGQPVVGAIVAGLVLGKLCGVLGTTALVTKATPLRLPDGIGLRDLVPVGFLTGIGFTVALLIAELSYGDGTQTAAAKVGILAGSLIAAVLGAATLRWDARQDRTGDMNQDGVPDVDTTPIGPDD